MQCDFCGEDIQQGQCIFKINDFVCCTDCINDNLTASDVLEMLEITKEEYLQDDNSDFLFEDRRDNQ